MIQQALEKELGDQVAALPLPIPDSCTCYADFHRFCLSTQKTDLVLERLKQTKQILDAEEWETRNLKPTIILRISIALLSWWSTFCSRLISAQEKLSLWVAMMDLFRQKLDLKIESFGIDHLFYFDINSTSHVLPRRLFRNLSSQRSIYWTGLTVQLGRHKLFHSDDRIWWIHVRYK